MDNKNSLPIGLMLGAIVPIIGFIVIEAVFSGLEMAQLIETASSGSLTKRERTIYLLAICCNIIPFNISKNRRWDNTMRGIVFPTLLYVGAWLYRYADVLF